jgi:ribosomal protein S18 acetylase RimI-like enzyme
MIDLVRLDLSDRRIAESVLRLQQRAYRIEADLIGSEGIPPLQETLEELQACGETFLGAIDDGELIGAISWRFRDATIDIHRLVVHPDRFRRRIGTGLVHGALEAEPLAEKAIVQTGAQNAPATALYEREGFEHLDEIDAGGGLLVARFAKRLRSPTQE